MASIPCRECEASLKFSHRIEDAVGLNIDWICAAIVIACVIIQQGEGFSSSEAIGQWIRGSRLYLSYGLLCSSNL